MNVERVKITALSLAVQLLAQQRNPKAVKAVEVARVFEAYLLEHDVEDV